MFASPSRSGLPHPPAGSLSPPFDETPLPYGWLAMQNNAAPTAKAVESWFVRLSVCGMRCVLNKRIERMFRVPRVSPFHHVAFGGTAMTDTHVWRSKEIRLENPLTVNPIRSDYPALLRILPRLRLGSRSKRKYPLIVKLMLGAMPRSTFGAFR